MESKKRTLGVLGGMGPMATADLMQRIIRKTPANHDQEHIPMVVVNNPTIPDRTSFFVSGGSDPFSALASETERLRQAGADCIVMPCNTAHYWLPKLRSAYQHSTISIISCVAAEAKRRSLCSVGLLATTGCLIGGMYQTELAEMGIEVLEPSKAQQEQVMDGIYSVKAGNLARGREKLLDIFEVFIKQGAQAVVFGCTEIPLALNVEFTTQSDRCLDSLELLAEACVKWAQEGKTD